MIRILKVLVVLIFLAFVGLVGFAYLGDMTPEFEDVREPVTLEVN